MADNVWQKITYSLTKAREPSAFVRFYRVLALVGCSRICEALPAPWRRVSFFIAVQLPRPRDYLQENRKRFIEK